MYILLKATLYLFGSVTLSPEAYTANQLVMFNPTNTPSPSISSCTSIQNIANTNRAAHISGFI